jgi:hypothetical protein
MQLKIIKEEKGGKQMGFFGVVGAIIVAVLILAVL